MKQSMMKIHEIAERFMRDEEGLGTVEIVLIIVVLIGLVALFKTQITEVVNDILKSIKTSSDAIIK